MGAVHAVVENDEEAKHGIGMLCRNFMGGGGGGAVYAVVQIVQIV